MVATVDDQSRWTAITHCLACGHGAGLFEYIDLGHQPLANDYHDGSVDLATFPLSVSCCRKCWHSQLRVAVDPDLLFKDYAYVSGTTATMLTHFDEFIERVESTFQREHLSILDIAGNDGSLLAKFAAHGHVVLNVDPATNLTATSEANGVPTLCAYWQDGILAKLDRQYDVIVAMNVLGHVADPLSFLVNCRYALADGGRVYIQTSMCEMLEHGEFDTIYHEHISYFTARSFIELARRSGLTVEHVDKVAIHGTSYLWRLSVDGESDPSVDDLLAYEYNHGYYGPELYDEFARSAHRIADFLVQVVDTYRDAGYACVGYGAAAKAQVVLNYAGVDLDVIVDDNPLKQARLTPGSDIPIVSVDYLAEIDTPMLCVITSWNYFPEIMGRIKAVRDRSDDVFMRYFPETDVTAA